MIDATTHRPLHVSTDGTAGPYIMVPLSQLDDVRQLLDEREVRYWVGENAVSMNGAPYIAVINLGREGKASEVQAILDGTR